MDDFWGVVWGASIALVASVIGGFMTSVLGPLLSRRADQRAQLVDAETERRERIRQAIQDASVCLRRAVFAWDKNDKDARDRHLEDADVISITLRLSTTHAERLVEQNLTVVMAESTRNELLIGAAAWEVAASDWFRGVVENGDFQEAFLREKDNVRALDSWTRAGQDVTDSTSPNMRD